MDFDDGLNFYANRHVLRMVMDQADDMGLTYVRSENEHGPYVSAERLPLTEAVLRAKREMARLDSQRTDRGFNFFTSMFLDDQRSGILLKVLQECVHGSAAGDVAECGAMYGETAAEMARYLERVGSDRMVHVFDSFDGFPDAFIEEELALNEDEDEFWNSRRPGEMTAPREWCEMLLADRDNYKIHQGYFEDTMPDFDRPLVFVHADADLYHSTAQIIEMADRCLQPGGAILFDDYGAESFPGVSKAVEDLLPSERYDLLVVENVTQAVAFRKENA